MALSLLGLLAICIVFFVILHRSYEDTAKQAMQAADNVAALVEQDIARNIELYNLSLQAVIDGIDDPQVMALPTRLRDMALFDRSATAEGLGSIIVFDDKGHAVLSSNTDGVSHANAAMRDYFQVHAVSDGDAGLYISHPFQGRLRNGEWMLALSRRLSHADGRFAGVVIGTIRFTYFQRLFRRINLGNQGSATLFAEDGTLLSRGPTDDVMIGQNVRNAIKLFEQYSERHVGSYQSASLDGTNRFFSYRQIANLPLIFSVGLSAAEIFSEWWRKALGITLTLLGLCGVVLALTLRLNTELRNRRETEKTLAQLATVDALTDLANRRAFDTHLEAAWQEALRNRKPLSLLMIDADAFKAFNDRHGHLKGDEVLRAIATCLKETCERVTDLPARYGGEEFVVLLPDTDLASGAAIAERIRLAVAALCLPHPASTHKVATVSIGVAQMRGEGRGSSADFVRDADRAMYLAKSTGRNRVLTTASVAAILPMTDRGGSAIATDAMAESTGRHVQPEDRRASR